MSWHRPPHPWPQDREPPNWRGHENRFPPPHPSLNSLHRQEHSHQPIYGNERPMHRSPPRDVPYRPHYPPNHEQLPIRSGDVYRPPPPPPASNPSHWSYASHESRMPNHFDQHRRSFSPRPSLPHPSSNTKWPHHYQGNNPPPPYSRDSRRHAIHDVKPFTSPSPDRFRSLPPGEHPGLLHRNSATSDRIRPDIHTGSERFRDAHRSSPSIDASGDCRVHWKDDEQRHRHYSRGKQAPDHHHYGDGDSHAQESRHSEKRERDNQTSDRRRLIKHESHRYSPLTRSSSDGLKDRPTLTKSRRQVKEHPKLAEDPIDFEQPVDAEEEIKKLKASYTQCTQHGDMYKRIMHSNSTVEATPKLKELLDRFEKQLSNRHQKLWQKNPNCITSEMYIEETSDELTMNQYSDVTLALLKQWKTNSELTRHQRVKAKTIVKTIIAKAAKDLCSLTEYIEREKPNLPNYCIAKVKALVESGTCDLITPDEAETDGAGELINTIRKLKAHPNRLHEELWYNEPDQANDGPLCHCSMQSRGKGIRHNIYPGETTPFACHQLTNNIGKLHHYRIMVGPATNFMSSKPTSIEHNNHDYMFEGFSIFSHEPLDTIPFCDMIRFHIRYTIYVIEETAPENFCMRGLELFHEYLFREVLELYDWQQKGKSEPANTETENFRHFRFYPRFVRYLPDDGKEILSLCKVLEYLMESDKPLVAEEDLPHLMDDKKCSHEEWRTFSENVQGMIVMNPGKKPSCLRVDQLDRYNTTPVDVDSQLSHEVDSRYPMIVHFGIRPANLSYAGDPAYQRICRAYLKLRHLMANSPHVKESDQKKREEREEALRKFRRSKEMQRESTVELSAWGFQRTGIFSDVCQHALILPTLTHHLRYHLCLASLEERIGYTFKERKWLSHAMSHPSCHMNFGLNPDHVRNVLSNCGLRVPKYGNSSIHYKYTRKRGITTLIQIMARLGQHRPVLSPIQHNERLEFLGDAVVGYLTSVHLFLMFPDLSEGALTTFRTVLVNNQHLATLAERLQLDEYMLYSHGPDLCRRADLRHAMANCFEALMGAIYMEAGLEKAKELFGKFLWETTTLQGVWKHLPQHQLQIEKPGTDRECIKDIPILQKLTKFEDSIGVKFNHIRLLAKSFTWRNVHENLLTHGHNQRLEFLGDSICNLVASGYLFRLYPTHHEGHLTLLRATIVNGRTQSLVATDLGMPEYVICNLDNEKGRTPEWKEKNLADLLEAFIAALYLDRGLKFVEGFMQVCFFPRLKEFILKQEWNDPKSCLQQCCLTLRQEGKVPELPYYKVVKQTGPSHKRKYVIAVYFQDNKIGEGTGESIQRAQRSAARVALNEYNFPQLEWQRRYVAKKHDLPYVKRTNLKTIELREEKRKSEKTVTDNEGEQTAVDGDDTANEKAYGKETEADMVAALITANEEKVQAPVSQNESLEIENGAMEEESKLKEEHEQDRRENCIPSISSDTSESENNVEISQKHDDGRGSSDSETTKGVTKRANDEDHNKEFSSKMAKFEVEK